MATYSEKLRDPRWQKKRLLIMERDEFRCVICGDKATTLNVHHIQYSKGDPWDSPSEDLVTVCEPHHKEIKEMQHKLNRALTNGDSFRLFKELFKIVENEQQIETLKAAVATIANNVASEPFKRLVEAFCNATFDSFFDGFDTGFQRGTYHQPLEKLEP